MPGVRRTTGILLACALLLAAFGIFALCFSHAAAWRLPAEDRPWVERTLDVAAAGTNTTREDVRRTTRPRLWHGSDRLCVILATHRSDGGGNYQACFDRKNGHLIEERLDGSSFGPSRIADPLWELVW
ncbi:MAG TPA: hypothetical protein VE053_03900 [Allosphingosinicella sp.]|nr:hypothetical protein [Allosphingosinicella sp.]